jgi:hypothetical protein
MPCDFLPIVRMWRLEAKFFAGPTIRLHKNEITTIKLLF